MKTLLLGAAASAALVAGGAFAAETPVKGGELKVAIAADIEGVRPGIDGGAWHVIQHHVAEGLVGFRENLSIGPAAAKSFTVSPDGKTFTFVLRDGLTFHDGTPVTAEDVKWGWDNIYLSDKSGYTCKALFDGSGNRAERTIGVKVAKVEAKDAKTVVITLAEPSGAFLYILGEPNCLPAVVSKKSQNTDGSWGNPIATGPYKLASWGKGQPVVITRYDGYKPLAEKGSGFAGARIAYLDKVTFVTVKPDLVPEALTKGEIDFAPRITEEKYNALSDVDGVKLSSSPSGTSYALLMQNTDPVLKDIRLRRAIAHAINYKELADATTQGRMRPNPSALPLQSIYHTKVHDQGYKFDPVLAKKLMAEAKYDGTPLKLEANRDRYPLMYPNALLIKRMLEAVGFKVDLVERQWDEQLRLYNEGKFQMQSFAYSGRRYPEANYDHFAGVKSLRASVQWESAKGNALVDKARNEFDINKRIKIFEEVHKTMIDEVPVIWLNQWDLYDAFRTNVHGYVPWVLHEARFWGMWKDKT
jgi:peptide/nickel transport system substrate-binding protein